MRKLALLVAILVWGLAFAAPAVAQDENSAPLYVRYCVQTRMTQGEDQLETALTDAETLLGAVEEFLDQFELGNRTYIEGISQGEEFLAEWEGVSAALPPCLAPLERDVVAMYQEILVAMLYGQLLENEDSQAHLAKAATLVENIRREAGSAKAHLSIPLPTPEPTVVETPVTPEPTVEGPTATPAPRTAEELTVILKDFLLQNGVTVLREAAVQPFPETVLITVQLNRFILNGEDLDYDNSVFTLDVLSTLLADWPELPQVSGLRVETFAEDTLSLVIEVSGDNFRAHYYDGTLNRDDYTNSFTVIEG